MTAHKNTFKLGLIGYGTISGTHAEAIANSKLGTLVAHSHTKANLESFCNQFEGRGYTDYKEPVISGKDSLKSLAFVRALYESAEQQQTVRLKKLEY